MSTAYQSWSGGFPSTSGRNVIAVQPGESLSSEIVYLTAHIDDMPGVALAPGADDNASGTAAVLTAAKIFSQQHFNRTIKYAILTGEEENLVGSAETAKQASRAAEKVVAVVNIDMIAWASVAAPRATVRIRPTTDPYFDKDLALASVFTNVGDAYGLTGTIAPTIVADGQLGDQASFWQRGYAGFMALEDVDFDFNPYYHTSSDTLGHFNLRYYTAFAQAAIGTAAQIAQPVSEVPFGAIEVASSDWRVGSSIGVGPFIARSDVGATVSGADPHDTAWASASAPTNNAWFKTASQPETTELQTDSRALAAGTVFSGNMSFVSKISSPVSSSNAVRFQFISPPLSNRVYAGRVRVDPLYAADGMAFEMITNLQQLVALGNGFVKLPTLTNLTNGVVYGTFDISARVLDRSSGFSLRVDSTPGQPLVVSVPAQVGAVETDVFEIATNLGPDVVWAPWKSLTTYVGAANSEEFDSGWSRISVPLDLGVSGEPGPVFVRLRRSWRD